MRVNGRYKFWCEPCDFVAKNQPAPSPSCPVCGGPMQNMGPKWPVGKKGKRVPLRMWRPAPPPGEVLLHKIRDPAPKPKSWRDVPW